MTICDAAPALRSSRTATAIGVDFGAALIGHCLAFEVTFQPLKSQSHFFAESFFHRSAHLFFINSDNRLLPSGVKRCPRFSARPATRWRAAAPVAPFGNIPSKAPMTSSIRLLSALSSETISAMFKLEFSSLEVVSVNTLPWHALARYNS